MCSLVFAHYLLPFPNNQFNFAVRRFLHIVTFYIPVILVCDDIQWCDKESMNVIFKTCLMDTDIQSLMIFGCYRSECTNANDNILLDNMIEVVTNRSTERSVHVTKMHLQNLSVLDMIKLFNDLLSTFR